MYKFKLLLFLYFFMRKFCKDNTKIQTTKVIFLIFDDLSIDLDCEKNCDPKCMVLSSSSVVLFPCTVMLLPCISSSPPHTSQNHRFLMEYRIDGLTYRIFIITYHTIINILNMYIIYYLYIKYTNKIYFYR